MIYDKKCTDCSTVFEVICKISEKESKVSYCPECGSSDSSYIPTAPVFLDSRGITDRHPAEKTGLDKVLKRIDRDLGTKCFTG